MMYAIVKAGRVVQAPVALTSRYQGIKAFHRLTDAQRTQHGWYPCIPYGYNYDPDTEIQTGPDFEFTGEVVKMIYHNRPMTQSEHDRRMAQRKREAMHRINAAYEAELDAILEEYPQAETKTWDKQETEARAYLEDSAAETPLMDAISAAREMDKAELANRIIAKADAWMALSGAATGKRQKLEDAVTDADTFEALDAIEW